MSCASFYEGKHDTKIYNTMDPTQAGPFWPFFKEMEAMQDAALDKDKKEAEQQELQSQQFNAHQSLMETLQALEALEAEAKNEQVEE
eukprot:11958038-Karenia_brevis.AAC.1